MMSAAPRRRGGQKTSVALVAYLALLISISALVARVEAKALNQNQVKFRRLPPKEFSAALGSSITIECEAGGSPPPSIHWLKNGNRILQNDLDENQLEDVQRTQVDEVNRIALSSTRSRLFIDCASFDDEAVYTCVAENALSRISSHTKLNLMRPASQQAAVENDLLADEVAALELAAAAAGGLKPLAAVAAAGESELEVPEKDSLSAVPQCLSQRSSRSNEPVRIHMWTHNIVEVMKNNVVLYCRSNARKQQVDATAADNNGAGNAGSGNGSSSSNGGGATRKAAVSWTLPDDKLVGAELKDKYEILDTGDLMIKDLSWSDMGSYVCTVSDELGSDSISSFVYPASVKSTTSKRATRLADFR